MNRPLRVHPRADLDVIEAFSFLAGSNPDAARRLLDAVEQALQAIHARPEDGHRYRRIGREDEDWRYRRLPAFRKYLVFYHIDSTEVHVVRIVYGARDLEAIFRVL